MEVYELNEPKERLDKFIAYWTAHKKNSVKMRFELEKYQPFLMGLRMGAWKRNEKRWAKEVDEAREKIDFLKSRYGLK